MAAWTHIAHDSLSLPASSVTWSSISGSYDHLLIKMSARGSDTTGGTSTITDVEMRMGNGSVDSGTNYSDTYLGAYDTTPISGRSTGQTDIQRIWIPSDSTTADTFSVTNIWIPNYTSTVGGKAAIISSSVENASTTTYLWGVIQVAGLWNPATPAAVDHLHLRTTAGNFMAYSTFDLYGILGA